ncbi:macoilin isoform X2 [Haematobia irritans]|uniref:macoilin isoform X2 n=1 Tax=Haematobia irritans TaxID=7368 RepID=UPI003F4FDD2B
MKRRNADCGKLRRPIKRNKITESMYGSTTVLYMKFLVLWAIVITADFMFMFRFEFLWPFWLLLRSVHDSFKYKGLAFSVLFVCIAITSDLVCLFFIPVNWLLFAASTYVWVQYVWHTDKGICLPTIILWMLFVYLEAGIRWKDSRHMPHLDLCRPFAAHCIGYPVVTLGFGFKSYVGYRMRQRKQREVAKENEFYMQLLQQALPQEEPTPVADEGLTALASNTSNNSNAVAAISSANHAVQNHHQSNSTASGASLTAAHTQISNSIATANGSVASAQNHNHQDQQQSHHHHNNHNGNCLTANGAASTASSAACQVTGVTNSNFSSSSNSSFSNNTTSSTSTSSASYLSTTLTASSSTSNDDKSYVQIGGGSGGGNVTANSGKNNRRSVDKENRHKNNNYHQMNHQSNESNSHHQNHNNNNKEKGDWDNNNYHQQPPASKEKEKHETSGKSSKKSANTSSTQQTHTINGNAATQLDGEEVVVVSVEAVEKTKGRRNRSKKENTSKDNHYHNNNNSNTNNNHHKDSNKENQQHNNASKDTHNQHHNSDASSVSSSSSSTSSLSSSAKSSNSATSAITHLASKVVSKICESCLKLEADVKKYRSEISHMKQIENELRQKLETNMTTKSCLQAKQKECDELEKRIHELTNARHTDMLQLQNIERRLAEERRQKQSLDAQLNNEKKARKQAEEKAARPECSPQCKQRKQQMDEEIKQLSQKLKLAEEAKQIAEQHGRELEQQLRLFEAEIRNRDSLQPGADVLMNALAAMQDKNCTLEKNLSAETRVKLDLFSALGDAKRQLEISESLRRSKEDEVHDLKAKIAQLLAVMPTDSLCLPSCSSTGASSMLRMNDTPPLQSGPGPASPMLTSLSAAQAQQQLDFVVNQQQIANNQQQKQQQNQCPCVVPVSVSVATSVLVSQVSNGVTNANGSNLDPNATVYTPKCPNNNGGNVVVVGGSGDA